MPRPRLVRRGPGNGNWHVNFRNPMFNCRLLACACGASIFLYGWHRDERYEGRRCCPLDRQCKGGSSEGRWKRTHPRSVARMSWRSEGLRMPSEVKFTLPRLGCGGSSPLRQRASGASSRGVRICISSLRDPPGDCEGVPARRHRTLQHAGRGRCSWPKAAPRCRTPVGSKFASNVFD